MSLVPPPPAEWAKHDAVWIGFPSHPDLWHEDLDPARAEVAAFARAVHADGRGETVILVAADAEAATAAQALAPFAQVVVEPFGDIWLRDTGPILLGNGEACDFGFNGWGGKYDLPGDDTIGLRLAQRLGRRVGYCNWVLEGGAIDGDGTGTVVTPPRAACRWRVTSGCWRVARSTATAPAPSSPRRNACSTPIATRRWTRRRSRRGCAAISG